MKTALTKLREVLRESYWFIPSLMAAASVVLALATISFGTQLGSDYLNGISWLYTRDPQAARDLLSVVGGSLITVAGVVFSVTLVALTNASSQFGTRILRTFSRDTGNKVVLGAFLGTFLYCLLVMRTITGGADSFVPHLSVLIGVVLAMLCFGLLIYFIHHVIGILQSDNVVSALSRDLKESIERIYPKQVGEDREKHGPEPEPPSDFAENSVRVTAEESDYLESIDGDALIRIASKHALVIRVERTPGAYVLSGTMLARAYPNNKVTKEIRSDIRKCFNLAKNRSYVQDVGFGFEQLVLVTIRALSPAVNNQVLAKTCVDRISEGFACLVTREMPSPYRADSEGVLRVIAPPVSFEDVVQGTLDIVNESAKRSPAVTVHILRSIATLIELATDDTNRQPLIQCARALHESALQSIQDDRGKQDVERAYLKVVKESYEQGRGRLGAA